jgi:hypothetical protein
MDATLLIASGQQSHVLVSSNGFMVYKIVGRLSGARCLGEYSTLEYPLERVTNIPFDSASMLDRQLIPAFFSTCSAWNDIELFALQLKCDQHARAS